MCFCVNIENRERDILGKRSKAERVEKDKGGWVSERHAFYYIIVNIH